MQVRGEKDYTSLVKGLITERSPILGEEQACQDELNFVFDLATGTRVKRKGFEYVSGYTKPSTNDPVLRTRFHWADQNLIVDVYQEMVTHDGRRDTVFVFLDDFEPYAKLAEGYVPTEFTPTYSTYVQVSALRDKLFVASGSRLFVLDKTGAEEIKTYSLDLYIRDFKLLPDGLRIGQRTGVMTEEHRYNLYNAGWYAERKLESTGALGDPISEFSVGVTSVTESVNILSMSGLFVFTADPVDLNVGAEGFFTSGPNADVTFTVLDVFTEPGGPHGFSTSVELTPDTGVRLIEYGSSGELPSNADIPTLGLKTNDEGDELFSKNTLLNVSTGNSEAPRGHYVYNITSINRDSKLVTKANDGTPDKTTTYLTTISW